MKKELSKDWTLYVPAEGYVKDFYDIKLFNGDIIMFCWPNGGLWNVCRGLPNDVKYHNANIPCEQAEFVRATQDEKWNNPKF